MLYSENGNNINMRLTISVTGKIPEVRKNPFRNSLKKGQVYFRFNTNSKEARVCVCVCVWGGGGSPMTFLRVYPQNGGWCVEDTVLSYQKYQITF